MLRPAASGAPAESTARGDRDHAACVTVRFDRQELALILTVYGRQVAQGEWRDYAMDFGRERAVFSVFRRTSECPLYRIEKTPKLARKQGQYSVVAPGGMILKRGHDLMQVLKVLLKSPKLESV
jgi:hypothetical protein